MNQKNALFALSKNGTAPAKITKGWKLAASQLRAVHPFDVIFLVLLNPFFHQCAFLAIRKAACAEAKANIREIYKTIKNILYLHASKKPKQHRGSEMEEEPLRACLKSMKCSIFWPLECLKSNTFTVMPKRWVVERSFAWLQKCRRLWKNCERKINTSLQMVVLAFVSLLLKRF